MLKNSDNVVPFPPQEDWEVGLDEATAATVIKSRMPPLDRIHLLSMAAQLARRETRGDAVVVYLDFTPRPAATSTLSARRVEDNGPNAFDPDKLHETRRFEPKKKPEPDEPSIRNKEAEPELQKLTQPLPISDFVAFSPDHTYIHRSTGEDWTATAVNARVLPIERGGGKKPLAASVWLDRNDAVEQRSWLPGKPQIIENQLVNDGGFFAKKDARVFNLYKPPEIIRTTDRNVKFWRDHLYELWPDQGDHIERWFAHRVQRPGEKINHCLLLSGAPGIGKDAVIEPLKRAVGAWNFAEISPQAMLGNFNEFVRSVVLRVSEIKDLGDIDRFTFYEACKTLMASPPDTLRCNPKYVKPYHVLNVTGVILTTNYKVSGLYLPADDRRHFVAWSDKIEDDYSSDYWPKYWKRLEAGGAAAVAGHLRQRSLQDFDPKAPPLRTQAFYEIVDAMRTEEESEMADVIEALGDPDILTVSNLVGKARTLSMSNPRYETFVEFLKDGKNRRVVSIRLEECGYRRLANPSDKRGRWRLHSERTSVYLRKGLTDRQGFDAVKKHGWE
jgi:hypothetical protein